MQRRTKEEWEELFREQLSSGMRQEECCRVRGISHATFKWRKKKHGAESNNAGNFVELPTTTTARASDSIHFSAKVELELPGGVVLRLSW